jgi:hypothetical protein
MAHALLRWITFSQKNDNEKTDLVISLINQSYFDATLIRRVSLVLYELKNPILFFKVMIAYVTRYRAKFDEKIYEHSVYKIRKNNPLDFDKELIKNLVADEGMVRFMATRLLDYLTYQHKITSFAFDILTLNPKPGSYAAVLQAVAYAKKINQPITWVK